MKRQAMNPILPIDTYIPDAEPHVFGDRIYLFGSHDTEGGKRYCAEENYLAFSAPTDDLSDWRCDGVIYEASQALGYKEGGQNDLYAPDVVCGNDGRYYLYYNLDGSTPQRGHNMIQVAVCDTPAGRYEYYGYVRNPDGTPYCEYLDADPAVINDDGVIRLYHGWSLSMVAAGAHAQGNNDRSRAAGADSAADERAEFVKNADAAKQKAAGSRQQGFQMPEPGSPAMKYALKPVYKMLFKREETAVDALEYPLMGANTVELEDDMLTVKGQVHRIIPGQFDTPKDSSFYGHAFYEASSIRKINGIYYFIYSSENSNELCYATSAYPDRDFVYGGTIISNGDVGYNGRKDKDRLNMTANNHGSLEYVNGQWYIFYHRQTHCSTFSRQACAEKVEILKDGSIPQVECTSCGLNDGPLKAQGSYSAVCACNITNGCMPHATNTIVNADIPCITHDADQRFITNIRDGSLIGFKYFDLRQVKNLSVKVRGEEGTFIIACDEACKVPVGSISWKAAEGSEAGFRCACTALDLSGIEKAAYAPLYLKFAGKGPADLLEITFTC